MRILGIETSCDETAAAVVEDGRRLLSNVVASSVDLHAAYGGVVPEIAARSHIESILPVINEALRQAFGPQVESEEWKVEKSKPLPSNLSPLTSSDLWSQIDAIAVTVGPGLSGSLLIGALTASTLSAVKNKPLYAINHVEAHVYATFITTSLLQGYSLQQRQPKFPLLALIVSGGHTQLVLFEDHFKYRLLGQTGDDAVGEAFDKVAKMLGLPYPGGPSISKAAEGGDPEAVKLPKARMDSPYNFSFSGLKTAVLRAAQQMAGKDYTLPSSQLPELLTDKQKADIAASFQKVAVATLIDSLETAKKEFNPTDIVIAGGVAANSALRAEAIIRLGKEVIYTDIKLCTDNAAMIAALGYFKAAAGQPAADPYSLDINPSLSMQDLPST